MRVARFSLNGEPKFGILDGPELVLLKGHPLVLGYETTGERVPLKDVKLLAPTIPSKVVCIGKNYTDHVGEMGLELNPEPTIFLKPSSSIIGPGDSIVLPAQSKQVDLEVELTIVMGQIAKNITEAGLARGVKPNPIRQIVTLFVVSLRYADDYAEALAARGVVV